MYTAFKVRNIEGKKNSIKMKKKCKAIQEEPKYIGRKK